MSLISRESRVRHAVLLAAIAVAPVALLVKTPQTARSAPATVRVVAGGRQLTGVAVAPDPAVTRQRLRSALSRLPIETASRLGSVSITYRLNAPATAAHAERFLSTGGDVLAVRWPVASWISAPVIRQSQRNTCEAAALAVLLAITGVHVPQDQIVAELPRSGPLDPIGSGASRIWGDPELGFVGRPNGGGVAGGFGVYPRPVAAVAARHRRRFTVLTGAAPQALYRRLLLGRAVMVWVGLSNGPYGAWRSPSGRAVRVNFGEHTVVLTGVVRTGALRVVDPLSGTRQIWSRARFELMWSRLGRRALGV